MVCCIRSLYFCIFFNYCNLPSYISNGEINTIIKYYLYNSKSKSEPYRKSGFNQMKTYIFIIICCNIFVLRLLSSSYPTAGEFCVISLSTYRILSLSTSRNDIRQRRSAKFRFFQHA